MSFAFCTSAAAADCPRLRKLQVPCLLNWTEMATPRWLEPEKEKHGEAFALGIWSLRLRLPRDPFIKTRRRSSKIASR